MKVEEVKAMLRGEGREKDEGQILLSSGSTMLNLACSGKASGAFATGTYVFFCGDSMCGKTWMGMSVFAEASIDSRFDDYRLIYDPAEHGALMDVERFFGKRAAERIEIVDPPSGMVEEFYFNVDDALEKGEPFIYVLDSQDALSSMAEHKKFDEKKVALRKGKETAGSFEVSKPKYHSSNLGAFMSPLKHSKSILLLLNQTRDSFDPFKPKGYSGGRALLFYATLQLWGSVRGKIEKTIKGKKRQQGITAKVVVKKNRISGQQHMVEFPIHHSAGIDDTGSMVSYMVSEKEWAEVKVKGKEPKIIMEGLGPEFSGSMDAVVRKIEDGDLVDDLKELVQRTWDEVEELCVVKRRKRY